MLFQPPVSVTKQQECFLALTHKTARELASLKKKKKMSFRFCHFHTKSSCSRISLCSRTPASQSPGSCVCCPHPCSARTVQPLETCEFGIDSLEAGRTFSSVGLRLLRCFLCQDQCGLYSRGSLFPACLGLHSNLESCLTGVSLLC